MLRLDWDAYDPPKVGAVAEYNVIYYHALREAAYLEDHGTVVIPGDTSGQDIVLLDGHRLAPGGVSLTG